MLKCCSGRSLSGRKRKRRKEAICQLAGADPLTLNKRRSSVSELTMLSLSGSFLDTPSPRGSNAGLAAAATPDAGNLRLAATSPLNAVMTPKKTPTAVLLAVVAAPPHPQPAAAPVVAVARCCPGW